MSDKITTLHLKNDPSTNIYPNVKMENIPLDVTIAQGGANLATSGTIYNYLQTNFISVNEDGDITREISSTDSGKNYKVTIGNGLLTLTALDEEDVTTFKPYGLSYHDKFFGYPNPDENDVNGDLITNKWSGFSEYAKKGDYPTYTDINNFTCKNENFVMNSARGYAELKNNLLVINAVIKGTSDSTGLIFFDFTLPEELGSLIKPFVANFVATMTGRIFTSDSGGKDTQVFLIKNNNTSFTFRFNDSNSINTLYSVIINVLLW